jgi:hypothetical protein
MQNFSDEWLVLGDESVKLKSIHEYIEKGNEICIEKIFIENSGFSMERKFILRERKWYLKEYNISNL